MDILSSIKDEITTLGFSGGFTTVPEFFSWLRKFPLIAKPNPLFFNGTDSYSFGSLRYTEFTEFMSGKFGVVYLLYREKIDDAGYIFLKTSPKHPTSLLLEGLLQSIAHATLKTYGFPKAVPRVLDIVKHPEHGIVIGLERNPGAQLLADYFKSQVQWGSPSVYNDRVVFSVLAQIATYLAILEKNIGMNHRDLTGTNVLMVVPTQSVHQTVNLDSFRWTIRTSQQAILIDFGFACVGHPDGKMVISAGDFLPQIDFCPKEGRDLFLFFASLWNVAAFRESLTDVGRGLFEKWLHDTTEVSWADWLITSAKTNLMGMYLLTNAGHFRSSTSAPIHVLADISNAYPEILQFEFVITN